MPGDSQTPTQMRLTIAEGLLRGWLMWHKMNPEARRRQKKVTKDFLGIQTRQGPAKVRREPVRQMMEEKERKERARKMARAGLVEPSEGGIIKKP